MRGGGLFKSRVVFVGKGKNLMKKKRLFLRAHWKANETLRNEEDYSLLIVLCFWFAWGFVFFFCFFCVCVCVCVCGFFLKKISYC